MVRCIILVVFVLLVGAVSSTPFLVRVVLASGGVCGIPMCAVAQHEFCDASKGTVQFNNCLTRNSREDTRWRQCFQRRLHDCAREEQAQKAQAAAKAKAVSSVCGVPICSAVQYEQCDAKASDFQDCLARNRQEEARWKQCMDQRRRKCEEEQLGK